MLLAARCAWQSDFSAPHTARGKPFVSHPRLHERACLCWQNPASAFPGATARVFALMLRGMSSPSCRACLCLCAEGVQAVSAQLHVKLSERFPLMLQPPRVPEPRTHSAGMGTRGHGSVMSRCRCQGRFLSSEQAGARTASGMDRETFLSTALPCGCLEQQEVGFPIPGSQFPPDILCVQVSWQLLSGWVRQTVRHSHGECKGCQALPSVMVCIPMQEAVGRDDLPLPIPYTCWESFGSFLSRFPSRCHPCLNKFK